MKRLRLVAAGLGLLVAAACTSGGGKAPATSSSSGTAPVSSASSDLTIGDPVEQRTGHRRFGADR